MSLWKKKKNLSKLIKKKLFSDDQIVLNTIDVSPDGVVRLKEHGSLQSFEKSFNFTVILKDDGSSSEGGHSCPAGSGCSCKN